MSTRESDLWQAFLEGMPVLGPALSARRLLRERAQPRPPLGSGGMRRLLAAPAGQPALSPAQSARASRRLADAEQQGVRAAPGLLLGAGQDFRQGPQVGPNTAGQTSAQRAAAADYADARATELFRMMPPETRALMDAYKFSSETMVPFVGQQVAATPVEIGRQLAGGAPGIERSVAAQRGIQYTPLDKAAGYAPVAALTLLDAPGLLRSGARIAEGTAMTPGALARETPEAAAAIGRRIAGGLEQSDLAQVPAGTTNLPRPPVDPAAPIRAPEPVQTVAQSVPPEVGGALPRAASGVAREPLPGETEIPPFAPGQPVQTTEERLAEMRAMRDSRRYVDIRGTNVAEPEDLHTALSPFNDPLKENLHVVLTDDAGNVLSHSMMSSGEPLRVDPGAPKGPRGIPTSGPGVPRDDARFVADIADRARRVGATRVYLAHQHPDGIPLPSQLDHVMLGSVSRELARMGGPEVAGSYVMGADEGVMMHPVGWQGDTFSLSSQSVFPPEEATFPWSQPLAGNITGGESASRAAVAAAYSPRRVGVLWLDAAARPVARSTHRLESLATLPEWLPQQQRAHGAVSTLIVAPMGYLRDAARAAEQARSGGAAVMNVIGVRGTEMADAASAGLLKPWSAASAIGPAPRARTLFSNPGFDPSLVAEAARSPLGRAAIGGAVGGVVGGALDPEGQRHGTAAGIAAGAVAGLAPELLRMVPGEAGGLNPANPLARAAGGAVVGATAGGAADYGLGRDRDPRLGAGLGALFGAGLGFAARPATAAAAVLSPQGRALFDEAAGAIDFSGAAARDANRLGRSFSNRGERLIDLLSDQQGPAKRLGRAVDDVLPPSRNPRDLAAQWNNRQSYIDRALRGDGVPDPLDPRRTLGPSLAQVAEPLGGNPELNRQALTYAVHKRLVGRGAAGYGGDAARHARMQALVSELEQNPAIVEFADRLRRYTDSVGDFMVRSGAWTPEQARAILDSDALYIPTRRVMSDLARGGDLGQVATGSRMVNVTPGVQSFTGSGRDVYDPARALIEYTQAMIRRGLAYRVGHSLFDAVDALGPEGKWILTRLPANAGVSGSGASMRAGARTARRAMRSLSGLTPQQAEALADLMPADPDPLNPVIWRNGPNGREHALVNAPDLYAAVSGLRDTGDGALRRVLDAVLLPLRHVFTSTTTGLSPAFSLGTNVARDAVDALAKTQAGLTPADIGLGYARGFGGTVGAGRFEAALRDMGLGHVTRVHEATIPSTGALQRAVLPVTRAQKAAATLAQGAKVGSGVTLLESVANASEIGPRLGEAAATLRRAQRLVDAGKWTEADALFRAATQGRELMDFDNAPGLGILREGKRYVPFFGSALQGIGSYGRAIQRNPKRVASVATAVGLASLAEWAIQRQRSAAVQARENGRLDSERSGYLFIPLSDDPDVPPLRIPLGQELGLVHAGVRAGLASLEENDPHTARILADALKRALPPGVDQLVDLRDPKDVVPPVPVFQQLAENMRNRREFDQRPVTPQSLEGLPPSEQRFDTTHPTSDLIAAADRSIGGQMNPLEAENLLRGVFSRYTDYATVLTDPIALRLMGRSAPREPVPAGISRSPLNPLSVWMGNPHPANSRGEERYYRIRDDQQRAEAALNRAVKTLDPSIMGRAEGEYGGFARPGTGRQAGLTVNQTDQVLKQIRTAKRQVQILYSTGKMPAEEARAMLDRFNDYEARITAGSGKALRRLKAAPAP